MTWRDVGMEGLGSVIMASSSLREVGEAGSMAGGDAETPAVVWLTIAGGKLGASREVLASVTFEPLGDKWDEAAMLRAATKAAEGSARPLFSGGFPVSQGN